MKNISVLLFVAVILVACNNNSDKKSDNKKSRPVSLTAAGATFPLPFYNLAIKNYTKETGILLTYGGIGSGGGIRSLKDKVVDFGATDAFLDIEKEADMPSEIVHVPTCIGAVVIAYNLPELTELKLSNQNLSDIFSGIVTKWNDERLKESNPDISLPDMDITVIHRSDGSGTTYIFSDFMSKISAEWGKNVGRGKSLKWPVGLGAKGNPGVAGSIKQTMGAIGYIGSEFAFAQKITIAKVENSAGIYIEPNLESISAAAQGEIPDNTKVMLTNSSNPNAYPICGFTWLIVYKEQNYDKRTIAQAKETLNFLSWIIGKEAQTLAQQVKYAPLPELAVIKAQKILGTITYDAKAIIE